MAVVIRLKRMGTIKKPFARIVVTDSRSPRDGRFIEEIGFYDMRKSPYEVKVDKERALYWIKNGARPSETVKSFLKKEKIM
ncbi:MAG: 30S ribosomal protein S16 [Candidatus Omnitrophica bacterium]|nr:30S ribosomal protein S16 [Candidatus Omnitrophota bacterium]